MKKTVSTPILKIIMKIRMEIMQVLRIFNFLFFSFNYSTDSLLAMLYTEIILKTKVYTMI